MNEGLLRELLSAVQERRPCAVVTVASTKGSTPRAPGARMIVYADGAVSGTIGGGKFEALAIEEARTAIKEGRVVLRSYPLHENDPDSFGAICGGEVTVFIEPQMPDESICLIGAGHCARAIADLARSCGMHVSVVDDRPGSLEGFPAQICVRDLSPAAYINGRHWNRNDAIVLVSRNFQIDLEALGAALARGGAGYIGMIGSVRKVRHVFSELRGRGVSEEALREVYAPIGLDIGADAPAEIAVSVLAEILKVLRNKSGTHLAAKQPGAAAPAIQ